MGSQRVRHDWVTELNWTCVVRSVDSGARLSGSAFWLLLSSYSTLGNLLKPTRSFRASLVSQLVKDPSAMRETWVWSLNWEDPLEEGMATHSSILAWRISMDREIWWATVHPVTKSQTQLSYWAHSTLGHWTSLGFSLFISHMEIIYNNIIYLTYRVVVCRGLLCSSDSKESAYTSGDPGFIEGSERCPGEWNGNPLQYSCLENCTNRGAG